ncbi:MAG: ChaB family protein [Methanosarcina barkeri]|nr:ChaB family protein [Methanosarcina sp. ERenArc_MAG2]
MWEASRGETAHRITWSAVKRVYENNSKGNWVKRIKFSFWISACLSFELLLVSLFIHISNT